MAYLNKIKGFAKTFHKNTLVFPTVSLNKRLVLITGDNGCGKTTYLKCISGCMATDNGFLKPTHALAIDGAFLPKQLAVKEYLNMLDKFQEKRHLLNELTKHFDVDGFLNKHIKRLSCGMAQRVALVSAFMITDKPLLLDEPMRGLDSVYKTRLIKWLSMTDYHCLIVTHEKSSYLALDCEVHAFESPASL